MREQRIEEASLNSWPATQQLLFDGWLLRFSQGYTKRANSVTPLFSAQQPIEEKIRTCEQVYTERQLPTVFRLPSFLAMTQTYDAFLERRGYQYRDLTLVLGKDLATAALPSAPAPHSVPLTTWLPIFCQLSQSDLAAHEQHRAILERIAARTLFAVLYHNEEPVACGIGVLEHDIFGIFDIVTDPQQRRKGYGTSLVNGMLVWARSSGASYAYLQVVHANQGAFQLYERLGFRERYRYWYRVHQL